MKGVFAVVCVPFVTLALSGSLLVSDCWADEAFRPLNSNGDSVASKEESGYIPPEEVQLVTPRYSPDFKGFEPKLGTYSYEISWQGIEAAKGSVVVGQSGLDYKVAVSARTNSFIDIFYKMRYAAQSRLSAVNFTPKETFLEERENSKVRTTIMKFAPDGSISAERETYGKNKKTLNFNSKNTTLDPFSAAFLARGVDWKVGDTKRFDTFNGKVRYLITLTAKEMRQIDTDSGSREVFVIVPEVYNLSESRASNKLKDAEIFLSADRDREVLKIVSSVFVGTVTAKLVSFEPAENVDTDALLALEKARFPTTLGTNRSSQARG